MWILKVVSSRLTDFDGLVELNSLRPFELGETRKGFHCRVKVWALACLTHGRTINLEVHAGEYDAATWAARSWMSFSTQQLSVALHRATALEIATALGLSAAADPRAA